MNRKTLFKMSRYIDVDLYIKYLTELKQSAEKYFRYEEAVQLELEINRIKDFPTVSNVQDVKHGKWLEDDYGYCHCSECRYEHDSPEYVTPYCPNCGAKMDKE